ncbi:DUF2500 domain-containing protein [Ornithinimicrobium faecis]|uniref:DUF2500 domain-containing protein n=1 Tax=Ornithinimicrobium faecis TaxID=2934158 RepID=A0ABY4YYN6_9MICO|nr:DUF2500 domain-containing protein [Ornithinimicrobium sp. HY1793]USQ81869.1 DUF2500 domain-containing protein [Ornithinimicrobium sp. HY1793]
MDLFTLVPLFIAGVAVFILFTNGRRLYTNVQQRKVNESAPVLTFPATVISKRDSVSGGGDSAAQTDYYVTFERLDLQRLEIQVEGPEFGMIAVGDTGRLTVQGNWFQGFTRDAPRPPSSV